MSARGCAGSALGVPSTITIDVANGIAISGNAVCSEKASMQPMASAPPAAPAITPRRYARLKGTAWTISPAI